MLNLVFGLSLSGELARTESAVYLSQPTEFIADEPWLQMNKPTVWDLIDLNLTGGTIAIVIYSLFAFWLEFLKRYFSLMWVEGFARIIHICLRLLTIDGILSSQMNSPTVTHFDWTD